MQAQLSLLGHEPPLFASDFPGIARHELSGAAWIEVHPEWLAGHWQLFETLREQTCWQRDRRTMYERMVEVPRLTARLPEHGPLPAIVARMSEALSLRYGQRLDRISAAWYRDGRDSVAPHGDRVGRGRSDCVVAIVSLGEPRRFLLKPVAGGPSRLFRLGHGDLIVMGGQCQRTWLHSVPKVARAGPRISVQFRPAPVSRAEADR
ncbi:MAG: alpha-ketoglutarate-dependent dioxygenase AlkB [Gammaproteobacteria bacterium]|nr:alpha-ketoglutarate-dependent dioxygenase AlkB [Gammaproteobacteria bacterium]